MQDIGKLAEQKVLTDTLPDTNIFTVILTAIFILKNLYITKAIRAVEKRKKIISYLYSQIIKRFGLLLIIVICNLVIFLYQNGIEDSFFQHEFWHYMNTLSITVILAASFILTILSISKSRINSKIFRTSIEERKDLFKKCYTSPIEAAGRKGENLFVLVKTIFIYLAILNLTGLFLVVVTEKSPLSTIFCVYLTIIFYIIFLGLKQKVITAKNSFLFLGAFGISSSFIFILECFIPAILGQIWAKEIYKYFSKKTSQYCKKVLAGFFLMTTWSCKKNGISVNPPSYAYNTTVLLMMVNYDVIILVCYGVIIYNIIQLIDVKGKEIKDIYKYWSPLIITGVNWVIVILLITYVMVNIIFTIFSINATTTLLTISGFLGIMTLLLANCNFYFIINNYKDKFSDNNKIFRLNFNICKLIIKILYKIKLIDKMFQVVWFQFFNKNQKVADLVNVISLILCIIAATIIRICMVELRGAVRFSYEIPFSPNILFVIWILFLAGFLGGFYRLLVNVSFRLVPFTFLYFPLYYKNIMARNTNKNKPTIDFYYSSLSTRSWFTCGRLVMRLGILAMICHKLYYTYIIKDITAERVQRLAEMEQRKIEMRKTFDAFQYYDEGLEILEKQIKNHEGSLEELDRLNRMKRLYQAKLHPEDAEIIYKDDPKGLKYFRELYPKNTTIEEQPLSNAPEVLNNFSIMEWAQENVIFIVIGIIVVIVVVYFIKKTKNKLKETGKEIIKKNDFGFGIRGLMVGYFVKNIKATEIVTKNTVILLRFTDYGLISLVIFFSIIIIINQIFNFLLKCLLEMLKNFLTKWYSIFQYAISRAIVIWLFSYLISVTIIKIFVGQNMILLLNMVGIITCITSLLGFIIFATSLSMNLQKNFSKKTVILIAFFNIIFNLVILLYKTTILDKIFELVWVQYYNKNEKKVYQITCLFGILLGLYGYILRRFITIIFYIIKNNTEQIYSEQTLLFVIVCLLCGSVGLFYKIIGSLSFKLIQFIDVFMPEIYFCVNHRNEQKFLEIIGLENKAVLNLNFKSDIKNVQMHFIFHTTITYDQTVQHVIYKPLFLKKQLKIFSFSSAWGLFYVYIHTLILALNMPNIDKAIKKSQVLLKNLELELEKNQDKLAKANQRLKEAEEELLRIQQIERALDNPQDAEVYLKDFPENLVWFREQYPKVQPPNCNDFGFDSFSIIDWAQTYVVFILISILVTLVIVYFVVKSKPKINKKEKELIKKKEFWGSINIGADFFLRTVWSCKKCVIYVNQLSYSYNTTVLLMMINSDIITLTYYFILIYLIIQIINVKGKEIKDIYKYWCPLVITAVNWVLVILIITYLSLSIIFIIFPVKTTTTLLTIYGFFSLITLLLAICNICFFINKYKDKFSDNNTFFKLNFNMCKLIIKLFYKIKLLDKIFQIVWLQFFNKNQRVADILNLISVMLCLIYAGILRSSMLIIRVSDMLGLDSGYSINMLFVIWILFLAGFFGCFYRLLVNLSFKIVPFTFPCIIKTLWFVIQI